MSGLADAVDPAPIRQLLAHDLQRQLFADDSGEGAADAVGLPTGGFAHLGDRSALVAPQKPQESVLAVSPGLQGRSFKLASSNRLRDVHVLPGEGLKTRSGGSQGESSAILGMAPDAVLVGRNKQAQIMLKAAAELGFTPSSRSRVQIEPEHSTDPFDRFFNPPAPEALGVWQRREGLVLR